MRQTGKVKWYNHDDGVGFALTAMDNETKVLLIHYKELSSPDMEINSEDIIEFDVVAVNKKLRAKNITIVKQEG